MINLNKLLTKASNLTTMVIRITMILSDLRGSSTTLLLITIDIVLKIQKRIHKREKILRPKQNKHMLPHSRWWKIINWKNGIQCTSIWNLVSLFTPPQSKRIQQKRLKLAMQLLKSMKKLFKRQAQIQLIKIIELIQITQLSNSRKTLTSGRKM